MHTHRQTQTPLAGGIGERWTATTNHQVFSESYYSTQIIAVRGKSPGKKISLISSLFNYIRLRLVHIQDAVTILKSSK